MIATHTYYYIVMVSSQSFKAVNDLCIFMHALNLGQFIKKNNKYENNKTLQHNSTK